MDNLTELSDYDCTARPRCLHEESADRAAEAGGFAYIAAAGEAEIRTKSSFNNNGERTVTG